MAGSSVFSKFKNMWTPPEDENNYEEKETIEAAEESNTDSSYAEESSYSTSSGSFESVNYNDTNTSQGYYPSSSTTSSSTGKGNVMDFNTGSNTEVILFAPKTYKEDTFEIADSLVKGKTIILNLELAENSGEARRILDFLSGASFAKQSKLHPVSKNTYIIAPMGVGYVNNSEVYNVEDSDNIE